jgi:hypothetical protein
VVHAAALTNEPELPISHAAPLFNEPELPISHTHSYGPAGCADKRHLQSIRGHKGKGSCIAVAVQMPQQLSCIPKIDPGWQQLPQLHPSYILHRSQSAGCNAHKLNCTASAVPGRAAAAHHAEQAAAVRHRQAAWGRVWSWAASQVVAG